MRTVVPLTAVAIALACSLTSAPAHARARVFVASYGNDANPCTFGSPCKTFQHAHDVVDAGGEVTAIDSAGFGPINITKAVTITSPAGVEAGIVPAAGGDGIHIQAGPNDNVSLHGLVIDGAGTGDHGIYFATSTAGSGILTIQDCVIRNFPFAGIQVYASGQSTYISNTTISNNSGGIGGGVGVAFVTYQTSHATLNRVEIVGSDYGMLVDGDLLPNNGVNWVSMNDSIIASSKIHGIEAVNNANGNPHTYVTVTVTRSSIVDGAGTGVITYGTGTVVQLNQSTVANNASGWSTSINGAVTSFGNNVISDTFGSGDGAPPLSGLK
jgi:hypothetical protein